MKILVKSEVSQKSKTPFYKDVHNEIGSEQLKNVFEKCLNKFGDLDSGKYEWVDEETVVVKGVSGLALHNFAIEAEAMGKGIEYEQQTVIRIK